VLRSSSCSSLKCTESIRFFSFLSGPAGRVGAHYGRARRRHQEAAEGENQVKNKSRGV
jgi:hypothetical protein